MQKAASVKRALWFPYVPLKAETKYPMSMVPSLYQKERETSLAPETENLGLRSLYKQTLFFLLIYYPNPILYLFLTN